MVSPTPRSPRVRRIRAAAVGLIAALLVGLTTVPASADRKSDLEEQQKQNAAERESLESSLEGTSSDLADVYLALDETNRRLPIAQSELRIANENLAAAQRERDAVQQRLEASRNQKAELADQIKQGEDDVAQAEEAMAEVARSAYRGSDGVSALSVIMNASSPSDFANTYSVVNSALSSQNERLGTLEETKAVNRNRQSRLDAVEKRIGELEVQAQEAVKAADAAQATAANLVTEISNLQQQQTAQAAQLEQVKVDGEARLTQINADAASLATEIQAIYQAEAAEREKQRQEALKKQQEEAAKAAQNKPSGGGGGGGGGGGSNPPAGGGGGGGGGSSTPSGALIPPISGSLHQTSPFGMRWYPFGGYYMHNGVDLRAGCGVPQVSSASGTVTSVRGAVGNGTHGNQVMINNGVIGGDSYVTVYNHLSGFAVSVGQKVGQGQTIGYTGQTGKVTGCHVHFEVWKNGKAINPMGLPGF